MLFVKHYFTILYSMKYSSPLQLVLELDPGFSLLGKCIAVVVPSNIDHNGQVKQTAGPEIALL